jgi:hypothetical protein
MPARMGTQNVLIPTDGQHLYGRPEWPQIDRQTDGAWKGVLVCGGRIWTPFKDVEIGQGPVCFSGRPSVSVCLPCAEQRLTYAAWKRSPRGGGGLVFSVALMSQGLLRRQRYWQP